MHVQQTRRLFVMCAAIASTLGRSRSYVHHHHDDIVESPTMAQVGAHRSRLFPIDFEKFEIKQLIILNSTFVSPFCDMPSSYVFFFCSLYPFACLSRAIREMNEKIEEREK